MADIQHRLFLLSFRKVATEHDSETQVVLIFSDGFWTAPAVNSEWTVDPDVKLPRQKSGNLYLSEIDLLEKPQQVKELAADKRIIIWNGQKGAWSRTDSSVRALVEPVDFEDFFARKLKGKLSL